MKKIRALFLLCSMLITGYYSHAQTATLREGAHNFTLQWIGWDNPAVHTLSLPRCCA